MEPTESTIGSKSIRAATAPPNRSNEFVFRHIPELDGFRGIAVLTVFIGHYFEFRVRGQNPHFATLDKLGVLLFFVLSGFLITSLLHGERRRTGDISFQRFYLRRVLRLFPALFIFLAAVAVLMAAGWITDVPKKEIFECLLYVRNIFGRSLSLGHLWSLSLEEQFYLLWPLLFLSIPLRRAAGIVAAVCLAFMAWRAFAIWQHLFIYEDGIFYIRPYFRFDSILVGAALAIWLLQSPEAVKRLTRLLSALPWPLCWGLLLAWTMYGEDVSRPAYLTVQELLVVTILAQLLLCNQTWIAALLRSRFLTFTGTISYSLYLWQQLFVVTDTPSWGILREAPLSLLLPIVLALTSYFFVERPLLKVKDHFAEHFDKA